MNAAALTYGIVLYAVGSLSSEPVKEAAPGEFSMCHKQSLYAITRKAFYFLKPNTTFGDGPVNSDSNARPAFSRLDTV